jgi:hypothetical protein
MKPEGLIEDLEFRLAQATAEVRVVEEELARTKRELQIARDFIPLALQIAHGQELDREFGLPRWSE